MKQVLQHLKTGETEIADVPAPSSKPGHVRIGTRRTLISAGTERMLVEFGKGNYLEKALQQPERVKDVIDKIKTDGLMPTVEAVQSKLDQPLPLGYCNAGRVLEAGRDVEGLEPGDRVVSNGQHAEIVRVPKNLCAKIPDGVTDDQAAFTVVGAIALQGLRLAEPTLGERFVVSGLGLIGLLAVQLLRANGCEVLGIDFDEERLALAEQFGAETVNLSVGEDPVEAGMAFSGGRGVDGVLICAATDSSEPVHQAARMSRKRGRIVLVGVTGLELQRADFYEKELSFQVSCSYGPGRYDAAYEDEGHDYPFGFVRWTEQRNFEAVLGMMEQGKLNVDPLITHRFDIDEVDQAYGVVAGEGDANPIGVVMNYPDAPDTLPEAGQTVELEGPAFLNPDRLYRAGKRRLKGVGADNVSVGAIGAGNYATRVLFPALDATGARMRCVASSGGLSGRYAGEKFGFETTTTDTERIFEDPAINTVIIATRHDTHVDLVCRALEAGKHVFVEKPLAIDEVGLERIESLYGEMLAAPAPAPLLMVGFNRRFAPHIVEMETLLAKRSQPKSFIMTVNAGAIPADHWTQKRGVGGGRIIGEACHFVDLLRHLADAPITRLEALKMGDHAAVEVREDKMTLNLRFGDGSIGSVHYLANGHKSFPKERLEVFCGGSILQLDNFRKLTGYGWPGFGGSKTWTQDKGNEACLTAFVEAVEHGRPAPVDFDELVEVTRATFEAVERA